MPMSQAHDTALLEGELARGEQTALELFQYIVVRLAMVAVGLQFYSRHVDLYTRSQAS